MTKSKFNLIKFSAGIFFVLQIIGAMSILALPSPAMAQARKDIGTSLDFTPQVTIPESEFKAGVSTVIGSYNNGTTTSTLLPQYIGAIYNYGLAIAGILATIMLMGAGVIWLTSGGDSGKVSQAKNLISGSIAGLIILVISWVILNTINPNLVALKPIETKTLDKVTLNPGCCQLPGDDIMTKSEEECDKANGTFMENGPTYNVSVSDGQCTQNPLYCVVESDCDGNITLCYETAANKAPENLEECKTDSGKETINLNKIYSDRCSEVKIKQGSSMVEGCSGKKIDCVGVNDGAPCQKSDTKEAIKGYCYNNLCYVGSGGKGEPCGVQTGAFCSFDKCENLKDNKYIEDKTGRGNGLNIGRECELVTYGTASSQMYCCYKESNYISTKDLRTDQNSGYWGANCGNEGGKCYTGGVLCPEGYNRDRGGENCNKSQNSGICCKAKK